MEDFAEAIIRQWLQSIPQDEAAPVPEEAIDLLSSMLQRFELYLPPNSQPYAVLYDWAVATPHSIPRLSRAARALIGRWLDGRWHPDLREEAQFNLLSLCNEIGDRSRLSEPIWNLYRRRLIAGEYRSLQSIPLTSILLNAMIKSQVAGPEPPTLWQTFLDGDSDGYLPGSPSDGFLGMLFLPYEGSREDRIQQLARSLHAIHSLGKGNLVMSAMSDLHRVDPSLARAVLVRAIAHINGRFLTKVHERFDQAIESTLQQLNQKGNIEMKAELFSQRNIILRAVTRTLDKTNDISNNRCVRTLVELESSVLLHTKETIDPGKNEQNRVVYTQIRESIDPTVKSRFIYGRLVSSESSVNPTHQS